MPALTLALTPITSSVQNNMAFHSIVCDRKQAASGIPTLLESATLSVFTDDLLFGDYKLSSGTLIMRRTQSAFTAQVRNDSLSGYLNVLSSKLRESLVLIVEADPAKLREELNAITLDRLLARLAVKWHVPVVWTRNPKHSAHYIAEMSTAFPPPVTDANAVQDALNNLAGRGRITVDALLHQFGSLEKAADASLAELCRLPNVGRKNAQAIQDLLRHG